MTEINMNELDYNRDTALFFSFFFFLATHQMLPLVRLCGLVFLRLMRTRKADWEGWAPWETRVGRIS